MGTTFRFTMPEGDLPEAAHPILKRVAAELAEIPQGQASSSIELTRTHGERRVVRHVKHGYSFSCNEASLVIPNWILELTKPDGHGIRITEVVYYEPALPFVESCAPYLGVYGTAGNDDDTCAEVDLVRVSGSPFPCVSIQMVLRPNKSGRFEGQLPDARELYEAIRSRSRRPHVWYQPAPVGLPRQGH